MSELVMRYSCTQSGCSEFNVAKEVRTDLEETANLYFPIQPLCGGCLVPAFRTSVDRADNLTDAPAVDVDAQEQPALQEGEPVTIGTAESQGPLGDEVRAANAEQAQPAQSEPPQQ